MKRALIVLLLVGSSLGQELPDAPSFNRKIFWGAVGYHAASVAADNWTTQAARTDVFLLRGQYVQCRESHALFGTTKNPWRGAAITGAEVAGFAALTYITMHHTPRKWQWLVPIPQYLFGTLHARAAFNNRLCF